MTDTNETFHVQMNQEAVKQALKLQQDHPEWSRLSLRLYLEGKGCDGFYYGVSFDEPTPSDRHLPQGDGGCIDLIVDSETQEYVNGSKIIWVDDERGTGFLVENPSHKKFRGKFFKRKVWKDKLLQKSQQPE